MNSRQQPSGLASFFDTPRGRRLAWYLYDFGNSAYAAVVLLAIYSAWFKEGIVGGAEGSKLWGFAIAIAMVVVALISPILGTIADRLAIKKRMLTIFTLMACGFTGSLYFVTKGDVVAGMVLFIFAEIGYRAAQVFYDAMLNEIADPHELGRVSGRGWAIGSMGGNVCLMMVLPLVVIFGGEQIIRLTMVITALFFLVFSLPLLLFVGERQAPEPLGAGENILSAGFKQLWKTLRSLGWHSEYLKFMIAFIFYNDGVMIALNFAAIIGAVLYGFERQQLIVLIILVGFCNVAGAWFFGEISQRASAKLGIYWALVAMFAAVVWLSVNETAYMFYVIAGAAGFAIAGLQASSRTMVAKLAPGGHNAEYFGLFAVAGRSSSVAGPAIFGWVAASMADWYAAGGMEAGDAEQAGMRIAIYVILAFLTAGTFILFFVEEDAGSGFAAPEQA
ncbi:MAG: MFS transporter [Nitratireductor sp.]|nr:MFS transporter [Nitratireductor sp.]